MIKDPTRSVFIEYATSDYNIEYEFNWKYLLNFVYFFLFISLGVLLSFLAWYFGGTISLICSAYPMLGCLRIAFLFLDWYEKYK